LPRHPNMKILICVCLFLALCNAAFVPPVKAGKYLGDLLCRLDPRITADTLTSFRNGTYKAQIFRYLFPNSCGRSRGIFTLDFPEYKGNTYSCANWPTQWGVNEVPDWFQNPSDYAQQLKYLDLWVQGVYNTTAVHGPSTCDFHGFTRMFCGADREEPWRTAPWVQKLNNKPLRGVNAGGIFVLEPWITPNFAQWSTHTPDQFNYDKQNPVGSTGYNNLVELWTRWYTNDDFAQMAKAGLNSIRLPVGWWFFADMIGLDHAPYNVPKQDIKDLTHPITQFIRMAKANNLYVMLDLHGAPGSQNGLDNSGIRDFDPVPERWGQHWFYDPDNLNATSRILVAMANYIDFLADNQIDNIIALPLLNEPWVFGDMSIVRDFYVDTIIAIRKISDVPLVIHDAFRHSEWDWLLGNFPFKDIVMDTHIYHAFNADDLASSTINCDHNKMIVAENIACGYGSMLRFKTCTSLPTFVGEWSLAVDDCIAKIRGAGGSVQDKDFGQCKNLKVRVGDPWWIEHYRSFAFKQMSMSERELGWFFWTWKTGAGSESDPSVAYWSFQAAIGAGIIPTPLDNFNQNITEACYAFVDTDPYVC